MGVRSSTVRRARWISSLICAALLSGSAAADEVVRSQRIGGLKAEIAALIVSGQAGGEVELVVTALPYPIAGETKQGVSFWIEARGTSILPQESLGRVEIYVYAVTETGGVAGALLETLSVKDDERAETLHAGGLRVSGELRLEPGDYSLRVLVREAETGRLGTQILSLTVPSFEPTRTWLLQPTIEAAAGPWLSVVPSGGAAVALGSARPTPRPVVTGGEISINLPTYGGGVADSLEVAAGGSPIAGAVTNRRPTPDGIGEMVEVTFDGEELAPGLHEIVVRTNDGGLRSPPLYLLVAPDGTADEASWVAVQAGAGAEATAAEEVPNATVPTRRRRRRRLDTEAESAAYVAVLQELANGATERADELLRDFERRVLREKTSDVLPELGRLKIDIATELAAVDAAAIAPIVLLHSRAYDRYFANREFLLSTFARRAIVRLGAIYVERAGPGPERARAADLYSSLACELQSRDHLRLSQETFARALDADPDHVTSLIGLATTYERAGVFEEALPVLRQLRRSHPSLAEPRLRLAIDQLRIGRRAGGMRELKSLIELEDAPVWILTVAYQEMARAHMARGRTAEAIELLRAAVERIPGDEQLRLLLAFAYDSQSEPWTARGVLREWTSPNAPTEETARRHYAGLSNVALPATLQRLAEWDLKNRSTLAEALRRIDSGSAR